MGLVVGGMATVAASVAVVCAVALTNSVALADSPGSTVASARVLVPASASPSPERVARAVEVTAQPEVVEAPAPIVVDDTSAGDDTAAATPAPPSPAAPAAPVTPPNANAAVEASKKAGTWDAVIAWARAQGWSQERIDEWVTRLEEERGAAASGGDRPGDEQQPPPRPPDAGIVAPAPAPERPADAGSTADRTESSDSSRGGPKKDRSRDSPDRRDR